jgi:hypothetical protein
MLGLRLHQACRNGRRQAVDDMKASLLVLASSRCRTSEELRRMSIRRTRNARQSMQRAICKPP